MASATDLCQILHLVGGLPERHVLHVSRELIDAGLLPKSVGRTVAQLDCRHAFALLVGAAVTERPKEAFRLVALYLSLQYKFQTLIDRGHSDPLLRAETSPQPVFGDKGGELLERMKGWGNWDKAPTKRGPKATILIDASMVQATISISDERGGMLGAALNTAYEYENIPPDNAPMSAYERMNSRAAKIRRIIEIPHETLKTIAISVGFSMEHALKTA